MPDQIAPRRVELRLLGAVDLRMRPAEDEASVVDDRGNAPQPLDADGATLVLSQPKRLALLAVLAVAHPDAWHSREKLLAMFWPERTPDRARAALSQAVYSLRRALGAELVRSRGTEFLALDRTRLATDVEAFDSALATGDRARALTVYRGDLMDGFFVSGAPEFEEWLEQERVRRRDRARQAAWSLAEDARRSGAAREAAGWAQRAHTLQPDDEAGLARLMDLLVTAGDPAAAMAAFEAAARRSVRDDDDPPSPELQRQYEALAARPRSRPRVTPGEDPATEVPISETPEPPPPAEPAPAQVPARRVPRFALVAALGVMTLVGAALWPRMRDDTAQPDRLAILPFEVQGDQRSAYLASGMASLLSATLDGAGRLQVVDSRTVLSYVRGRAATERLDPAEAAAVARHFRAEQFILGTVVDAGDSLRAIITLYDARAVPRAVASASARAEDEVFGLVEALARGLLQSTSQAPALRYQRLGIEATRSIPALKAYLDGEAHFRDARYQAAFDDYTRAVALDTTFAIAHLRRAVAADWVDARSEVLPSLDAALRHAGTLGDHERRFMGAIDNYWRGSAVDADTAFVHLLRIWPDDVDAWFQYGELLFHQGPILGRPSVAAGTAFRRVLALHPEHESARGHLVRVALLEGNVSEADSLMRLAARRTRGAAVAPEIELQHALITGDSAAFSTRVAALRDDGEYAIWVAGWRVATYTHDLGAAIRILMAATTPDRSEVARSIAYLSIAHLEVGRGRWSAARDALRRAESLDPVGAAYTDAFLQVLPFAAALPDHDGRLAVLPAALAASTNDPRRGSLASTILGDLVSPLAVQGMLALRTGDATAYQGRVAALMRSPASDGRYSAVGPRAAVRALAALARDDRPMMTALVDSLATATRGLPAARRAPAYSYALENFVLAELLLTLGQDERALARFAAFGDEFAYEAAFYAPAHLRRAQLLERSGRRTEAAREYAAFVRLWQDADASLQPQVETARARLRTLRVPE